MGQTALSESLRGVEAEIAARQPERALLLSQDVQARFPRALAVQRVIGEVYLALRKTREAIGALDRALAGNPEDARACCARAIVQQIQGDSMGALAWYRRACDIRPSDKVLLSAYSELARSLNQPSYEPSRTGLARLYLRGDLFPHAIREWETILSERPDALDAQLGLAETLWRAGNTQAAAERSRRLLLNAPSCVKALLILAAIEHDAGHDDEARNQLRRAAELDPDMRIAREVFAEHLAANDRALSLLVFGEEPSVSRAPSVPLAPSRITTESRTDVSSRPAARVTMGAQGQPQAFASPMPPATGTLPSSPTTGMLPPGTAPQLAPAAYAASAPVSGPSNLPPDFHRIFSETKNMLWGDEAEAQETQGRMLSTPAFDRSRADPFARSQVMMPPPLMSANGSLEDTEARLSMNFLGWLQAQGALAQDVATPGVAGNTGPVPVPLPPRPHPSSESPHDPRFSYNSDMGTGPLATGPLPPPTSEALKAMFAELEPEAASPRIVDALPISETLPESTPVWSDTNAAATGWIVGAFAQNTSEPPGEADVVPSAAPEPEPVSYGTGEQHASANDGEASWWAPVGSQRDGEIAAESATGYQGMPASGGAAMTLEALEHGLAQSG
ncbi:MAG: tetratricopeptide repeat protein, partial [Ktedonobacterales bacterium]